MDATCEYISGAANTVSGSTKWIDFQNSCYIVFGIHNVVAISDFQTTKIISTLKGHKGKVTTIDSIIRNDILELFTGSEDSTIKVWRYQPSVSPHWSCHQSITGWKSSIISLTVCYDNISSLYLFGSDSMGHINVWNRGYYADELFQNTENIISIPTQQPRIMKAASHCNGDNQSEVLLFVGSVDSKIHIRYASPTGFKYVGCLMGHEEWITSLAIYHGSIYRSSDQSISLTLASAAQDNKIRIWRFISRITDIKPVEVSSTITQVIADDEDEDDALDAQEDAVVLGQEENLSEARLQFHTDHSSWEVYLDALLIGHEDWVTSISFIQDTSSTKLYSTSMDRNMIIWSPDLSTGQWLPLTRMGDIGGTLGGAVGQNLLGFIDGVASANGHSLLGIGYGGSFHLWRNSDDRWMPLPYHTGHFASVNDISWQPASGNYLVSVSSDQTCRLFAPILDGHSWKEVSRPQIHGYDINCLALDSSISTSMSTSSYVTKLYSGSDEKVIRVFEAPGIVLDGLQHLCGIQHQPSLSTTSRIHRAYLPELGLSNKASEFMSPQEVKEQASRGVVALDYSSPPLEGQLADHTIWPEVKKLFGHRNEVMCMDLSADGMMLASACKARDAHDAKIMVWDMIHMTCMEMLGGHESTIVRLRFSNDGNTLVSVGKDRSIVIHHRSKHTSSFQTGSHYMKKSAHKRIIWDCCWLHGGNSHLVTASRDGACKVWQLKYQDDAVVDIACLCSFVPFNGVSVTAIDVAGDMLLLGSEEGDLSIWMLSQELDVCSLHVTVPAGYCHGAAVKRVCWQPSPSNASIKRFASCGEDNTVRILHVT